MSNDSGRWRRAVRGFTVGSGPLKRTVDRIEFLLRLLLLGLVLASVPIGILVATATAAHWKTVAASEAASRQQVTARLLQNVDTPVVTSSGTLNPQPVVAGWTAPDGTPRQGFVAAPAGAKAGSSISLWTDRTGAATRPPLDSTVGRARAVTVGAATALGIPLVAVSGYLLLVRGMMNSRRLRRWADEWSVFEPRWTRRVP